MVEYGDVTGCTGLNRLRPGNGLPGKRLEWWRPRASCVDPHVSQDSQVNQRLPQCIWQRRPKSIQIRKHLGNTLWNTWHIHGRSSVVPLELDATHPRLSNPEGYRQLEELLQSSSSAPGNFACLRPTDRREFQPDPQDVGMFGMWPHGMFGMFVGCLMHLDVVFNLVQSCSIFRGSSRDKFAGETLIRWYCCPMWSWYADSGDNALRSSHSKSNVWSVPLAQD